MVNRFALLLLTVMSIVTLSACSTIGGWFEDDEVELQPEPLTEITMAFTPDVVWKQRAGDGADDTLSKLASWWQNDKLFAVDTEGEVFAFDALTGKQLWKHEVDESVATGIGGGIEMVFVGTQKGELVALSEHDGMEIWRSKLTSEILAPTTAQNGVVVSRTADGRVSGLAADDGTVLWSYQRAVPLLSLRGVSRPVIDGDRVIAGYDNGKLVALSLKEGKVIWEKNVALPRGRTELERLVDIDADPVVRDGRVYVVTYQGNLVCLDTATGRTLWSREMSSQTGIAVAPFDAVYVTDDAGYVWSVQDGTGDALWRQTKLLRRQTTAPVIAGNFVVVGDYEGYLHWISREDGRFVSRQRISDEAIRANPFVKGDLIYVTASDGKIAAVRVP